jgi:hypothetical protein
LEGLCKIIPPDRELAHLEDRNGEDVLIGRDPWINCKGNTFFQIPWFKISINAGFSHLHHISRRNYIKGSTQWLNWEEVGLNEKHAHIWKEYIDALSSSMVTLTDQPNSLIWSFNLVGTYTPKQGYLALILEHIDEPAPWWGSILWKLNCPPQEKLFMWLLLTNKAPTWDNLQKHSFVGPGFALYANRTHRGYPTYVPILPFSKEVWSILSSSLFLPDPWHGTSVEDALKSWLSSPSTSQQNLPLIAAWGISLGGRMPQYNNPQ